MVNRKKAHNKKNLNVGDTVSSPTGLFATDMDGTLLLPGRDFHRRDLAALESLGEMNILRVIATGRSPFSFDRIMGERILPVDYLVLSSGAGIQDYRTGEFLRTASMNADLTSRASNKLIDSGYDFCIQKMVPDNHVFVYSYSSGSNLDLESRIALYTEHCRPIESGDEKCVSTQIVIVVPPGKHDGVIENVRESLGESYSIVRTTSPLDGKSLWVEIFPAGVSKSFGVKWIADKFGLSCNDAAAVGNDYNDHDLLEWAGHSFVVEDSPEHLRTHFREVSSAPDGGVAEAARLWLIERGELSIGDNWPV